MLFVCFSLIICSSSVFVERIAFFLQMLLWSKPCTDTTGCTLKWTAKHIDLHSYHGVAVRCLDMWPLWLPRSSAKTTTFHPNLILNWSSWWFLYCLLQDNRDAHRKPLKLAMRTCRFCRICRSGEVQPHCWHVMTALLVAWRGVVTSNNQQGALNKNIKQSRIKRNAWQEEEGMYSFRTTPKAPLLVK